MFETKEPLVEVIESDKTVSITGDLPGFEIENIDVKLGIISPENTRNMTNINPKKQAMCSVAQQEIHEIFLKRAANKELRWCLTQYPTNASAGWFPGPRSVHRDGYRYSGYGIRRRRPT